MRKILILIFMLISNLAYAQTEESEPEKAYELALGAGLSVGSTLYKGEKKTYAAPFPYLEFNSKYLFWSGIQGGVHLYRSNSLKVDLTVSYLAMQFSPEDSDDSAMKKLDKRKPSAGAGFAVAYKAAFGIIDAGLTFDVLDISRGFTASANYTLPCMITEKLLVYGSIGGQYNSAKHNNYYFGVTQEESLKSGIKSYKADGSIELSLGLGTMYDFTDKLHLLASAQFTLLSDEITDSPMLDASVAWNVMLGVLYSF